MYVNLKAVLVLHKQKAEFTGSVCVSTAITLSGFRMTNIPLDKKLPPPLSWHSTENFKYTENW